LEIAQIIVLTCRRSRSMIAEVKTFAKVRALMTYGPSLPDLYRRAATYVDQILKGANLAELPVEQPMTFALVIILKTVRALGIIISPSLLFQADAVLR
jgi:putative ABC transport system substrate-binding protein